MQHNKLFFCPQIVCFFNKNAKYRILSITPMWKKHMNAEERAKAIRKFFWGKNAEGNLNAMAIFLEAMGGGKFERKEEKTD